MKTTTPDERVLILGEYISADKNFITSIERTNQTDVTGKWFFLCKKTDEGKTQDFIDRELQQVYWDAIPNDHKIAGYPTPHRSVTATYNTVGLYADMLRGFSNLQEDEEEGFDQIPEKPRKRQTLAIDTVTMNKSYKTAVTGTTTSTSSITTDSLKALEEKISAQMREFEKQQEKKLIEMQQQFQKQLMEMFSQMFEKLQAQMLEQMKNLTSSFSNPSAFTQLQTQASFPGMQVFQVVL